MIEISIPVTGIVLTVVSIGIAIYSAYQIKKRRHYEQLPHLSCKVKSSVFRIEGNKELKAIFMEPLIIQIKNVGRGPALQIRFSSDFDSVQIPDLSPRETYEVRLPTGEEILKIDTEGEFDITYRDTYLNGTLVVYNYSIIFDEKMILNEIIRKSIKIQ